MGEKKKKEDEANGKRIEKRGLWALIMAQTGMGVFTGEQITSFFVRMVRPPILSCFLSLVSKTRYLTMRVFF